MNNDDQLVAASANTAPKDGRRRAANAGPVVVQAFAAHSAEERGEVKGRLPEHRTRKVETTFGADALSSKSASFGPRKTRATFPYNAINLLEEPALQNFAPAGVTITL